MYVPFYESYVRACLGLMTPEQRLRSYDTTLEYGLSGTVPDLRDDPLLQMAFDLIKPNIDATLARSKGGSKSKRGKAEGKPTK